MNSKLRVKPFRGLYYNPGCFKKLEKVVCPPYDVISKEYESELRASSPYNFCNLTLKDKSSYKQLGLQFKHWLKEKALVEDSTSSFYLTEQRYRLGKKTMVRYGFLGLLRLDEDGVVFPHEKTHSKPKKDRLKVLKNVKANLSPIFLIYPTDAKDPVTKLINKYKFRKTFLETSDSKGVYYKLWKIDKEKEKRVIEDYFKDRSLLIADGHHRFEVARTFYRLNKSKGIKDLNYMLAYFTPQNEHLLVLPTHRVLKKQFGIKSLIKKLSPYFGVKEHKTSKSLSSWLKRRKTFSFGFYQGGRFLSFCLKNKKMFDKMKAKSDEEKLDVILLHENVFKGLLGLSLGKNDIEYKKGFTEAVEGADKLKGSCFLMRAVNITDITNIAFKGGKLPQKTTYFYPKFLSGLISRKL